MPSPTDYSASLQSRTLLTYLALAGPDPDWSRRLVMLHASATAEPTALAAIIAGAAVLWTCSDAVMLRNSGEQGTTDFQVTTLSEALRILKNEIRRGLPVSVGVLDTDGGLWQQVADRGVQPFALHVASADTRPAEALIARGARRLDMNSPAADLDISGADSWRERKSSDAGLLLQAEQLVPPQKQLAWRWLQNAPRLFPRDTFRCYARVWHASNRGR